MVLYHHDPLLGVLYTNALTGTTKTTEPEFDIQGFPYFFSSADRQYGYLVDQWYVNNHMIQNPNAVQEDLTVIRGNDTGEVTRNVVLRVQSSKHFTQTAAGQAYITFTPQI